jgi:hypothetical protein
VAGFSFTRRSGRVLSDVVAKRSNEFSGEAMAFLNPELRPTYVFTFCMD